MAFLSKFAHSCGSPVLNVNCYEVFHPWHHDCWVAIAQAIPGGFLFCLKTYSMFYLIATLVAKKDPRKVDWKRYIRDVLQSSIFLTMNLFFYVVCLCRVRQAFGFFTPFLFGGLSSFIACYLSILFEKKSRRPALALYLANLASETMFRQAVHHGYMFRIKYGECIPFAAGLLLFMHLYSQGRLSAGLKNFLGITHKIEPSKEIINSKKLPTTFQEFLTDLRTNYSKSDKCHHENSCISVIGESFVKNFSLGFGISSLLVLLKNIKNIFTNPVKVIGLLLSKGNIKLPLFFALMPFLFHTSRCTMNRHTELSDPIKNLIAAAISSASMAVQPNVSIAMYTLWKGIEAWYYDKAERGKLPYVPYGDIILYALSCGYVLWMAALEPHAVRKGYQNFLSSLTGNRISFLNRKLIDYWGFRSSRNFPYTPVLNPKFVTINPMLYQPIRPP